MRGFVFVLFALGATLASAAPLPVRNGAPVRVSGQRATGLKAAPGDDGWRLEVGDVGGAVEIIDVTPGTPARTLHVVVDGGTVRFDPLRFAGGHVYRVQARHVDQLLSAYVYLYPNAAAAVDKAPTRFDFSRDE